VLARERDLDDDAGLQNVGETLLDGVAIWHPRRIDRVDMQPCGQTIEERIGGELQEPGRNDPDAEELERRA
jgi:hypothetical protein